MKIRNLSAFFFFFLLSQTSFAQMARDAFMPQVPITWLGIDFSNSRFIGDYYKFRTEADASKLMLALNDLMVTEQDKYNVAKMLGKQKVELKLQVAIDHNKDIDVAKLLADSTGFHDHLQMSDIEAIVSSYDFKGNTGIGMMYNVETFNKKKSEAVIWVTFINMDTKQVLLSERMRQEPGGFGLRNFWAGSIDDMMIRIRKKELKFWRLKYAGK